MFSQVLSSIQVMLDYIPNPERTRVGIITYGSCVNILLPPTDLSKDPEVVYLTDMDEPECPFPISRALFNVASERDKLDYVVSKTLEFYSKIMSEASASTFVAPSLGGALAFSQSLLAKSGGSLVVFAATIPLTGFARIKNRNDAKLYNTEKEKALYEPQIPAYNDLGWKLLGQRIAVNLFVFNSEYFDLPTIAPVATLTGGTVVYYPKYDGHLDAEKLHYEVARILTRYQGFDVVMKLRTSQGLSVTETISAGYKKPGAEIEFSTLDADKSLTFLLKQDDKITDPVAYAQLAVLYTNTNGDRVLRISNLALQVSDQVANIFRSADADAIALSLLRKHGTNLASLPGKTIRDQLTQSVVNILYAYRDKCASSSAPGQLILPESLKLLPLYVYSFLNKPALRTKPLTQADQRIYEVIKCCDRSVTFYLGYLYPKIYALHNFDSPTIYPNPNERPGDVLDEEGRVIIPSNTPARQDRIEADGVYLFDDSEYLRLYVFPPDANSSQGIQTAAAQLFGLESPDDILSISSLPSLPESDLNVRVNNVVEQIRKWKNFAYQSVRVEYVERPSANPDILGMLVEDEIVENDSYTDYLCSIHKLIQQKYQ
eukprot:TRINITY_DN12740_c0_g2_i1.p1 TRINITY_DN12740_c0_g2~~TRINITY_DN12740_c0_g2_i1.p1  ORF type:complete len:602 (-),score=127.54 TRINITY_DN12740_c0_g2_i1:161-1966(-)